MRGKDYNGFSMDLDKFAKQIEIDTHTLVRHLALFVFRGVVMKTPVDKGRARASWNISIGKLDLSVAPKGDFVDKGIGKTGSTRRAMSKTGKLSSINKNYPVVYITNNLPYIKRLEEGWSVEQSPNGMVRVTLVEAEQYLESLL